MTLMELIGTFINQDRYGRVYLSLDEKSISQVKTYHQKYKEAKKYTDAEFTHPLLSLGNLVDFDQVRVSIKSTKDFNYLRGGRVSIIVKATPYNYKDRKGYCFHASEPMSLEPLGNDRALRMDDHGYHAYLEIMKDY